MEVKGTEGSWPRLGRLCGWNLYLSTLLPPRCPPPSPPSGQYHTHTSGLGTPPATVPGLSRDTHTQQLLAFLPGSASPSWKVPGDRCPSCPPRPLSSRSRGPGRAVGRWPSCSLGVEVAGAESQAVFALGSCMPRAGPCACRGAGHPSRPSLGFPQVEASPQSVVRGGWLLRAACRDQRPSWRVSGGSPGLRLTLEPESWVPLPPLPAPVCHRGPWFLSGGGV